MDCQSGVDGAMKCQKGCPAGEGIGRSLALRAVEEAVAALITCDLGSDVMGSPAVEKNLCRTYCDDWRACV